MNLSEMFAKNQGRPVQIEGRLAHPSYERVVQPNEQLRLTFVGVREAPLQGIQMTLGGGKIQVEEYEPRKDIVLWTNTAPRVVVFRCIAKKPSVLHVWNCWLDEKSVMQAWIGNAGMLIEEGSKGAVRLLCNSRHELSFGDLIVDLETA